MALLTLTQSHGPTALSRLEAEYGDPLAALNHITLAIDNFYDSGNVAISVSPWQLSHCSSTGSDGTRRQPPSPVSRSVPLPRRRVPEITTAIAHLREVLGDQTYESLAHKGETMTTAAMVTYAYDQIDQARAELKAASK